ncbi:MAG: hypothetical protein U0401_00795 [Anaerolineae bacterium]
MILLAVLLAASACAGGSTATPASDPAIFFPRQKPVTGKRAVPTGEISGKLVLSGSCLRLNAHDGVSYTIIWLPDFTLRATEDAIQILDGSHQVVGRVGDEVYLDGGETKSVEGIRAIDEKLQQELPLKCQDPYWLVGYVVKPLRDAEKPE